jgi:hypothetical protein
MQPRSGARHGKRGRMPVTAWWHISHPVAGGAVSKRPDAGHGLVVADLSSNPPCIGFSA